MGVHCTEWIKFKHTKIGFDMHSIECCARTLHFHSSEEAVLISRRKSVLGVRTTTRGCTWSVFVDRERSLISSRLFSRCLPSSFSQCQRVCEERAKELHTVVGY